MWPSHAVHKASFGCRHKMSDRGVSVVAVVLTDESKKNFQGILIDAPKVEEPESISC